MKTSGVAIIEDDCIVIRFDIKALQTAIDGAYSLNALAVRQLVTSPTIYAEELKNLLNREDEQGTTQVHKLMDWAFNESIEQGCEGIDHHPIQEKFKMNDKINDEYLIPVHTKEGWYMYDLNKKRNCKYRIYFDT